MLCAGQRAKSSGMAVRLEGRIAKGDRRKSKKIRAEALDKL